MKWAKYDAESDPHFFKPDVFDSLDKVQAAAREFKRMHNGEIDPQMSRRRWLTQFTASNVRINGKYTTYMDFNDEQQPLPAYVTRKGSELYSIRAFHQMHCVVSLQSRLSTRI